MSTPPITSDKVDVEDVELSDEAISALARFLIDVAIKAGPASILSNHLVEKRKDLPNAQITKRHRPLFGEVPIDGLQPKKTK